MNKYIIKIIYILSFVCFSSVATSQIGWIQKASFPGAARDYDAGVSMGHYGFIGCGFNGFSHFSDFYKWDQTTNLWTAITSYPGTGYYYSPISFSIEGYIYVGLGWTGSVGATDLWKYDTTANTWTQMATFPGQGRYDANYFIIGHKAYIVNGSAGGPPYINDAWVYDARANTWKKLNIPPAGKVDGGASFAIGKHGYFVGGWDGGAMHTAGYEYDTATDTWTSIPSIPNYDPGVAGDSRVWVKGSKAYVFNGHNSINHTFTEGWVYDTIPKSWCEFTDMGKMQRCYCAAFVINNKFYMGTGIDSSGVYHTDYWEYDPITELKVNDTNKCNSDSVHFTGLSTFDSTGSVIWSWSFPGGSPSASNLQDPVIYYSTPGTYSVTLIVDACGGDDTVTRNITVIGGSSNMHIFGKTPICLGSIDTIIAAGGGTYLWNNGATTSSIIVKPIVNTSYSVHVSNGGCSGDTNITIIVDPSFTPTITGKDTICSGDQDNIIVTGGGSYLWSNGETTNSIIVAPVITTTYSVKITNGCSKDTSFTVNVVPLPKINISASSSNICSGHSVIFNATGATSYQWLPANAGLSCTNCPNPIATPSTTTNYKVIGTDSHGCSASANFTLYVEYSPSINVSPAQNICAGFSVDLFADATGGSGVFNWQPGNSSASLLTVSPSVTTTYTVSYINACGISTDTVTVFVNPAPITRFNADIISGCAPLCIQFRDISTLSVGKITMWNWAFGNGDTVNEESPIYCYSDTGTFSPTLTTVSNKGCSSTLKIVRMITVFSKPIASFAYLPNPVNILEPTVQFIDQSRDAYGIAYRLWNFGNGKATDGENLSMSNPSHTYQDTGTFCPQLVVENNKGCLDTVTNCLFVEPLYTLYIPSSFSPNGDGTNDIFEAKGTYVKSFEMYIFDRWGMELFHSKNINRGWDGTVGGGNIISQEDSYVYKIMATDWSNTQHSYVGEVTLIK